MDRGNFVELEFAFSDDAYPAVQLSKELGCRLELLTASQANPKTTVAYFHVTDGGDPDAFIAAGQQSTRGENVRIVERYNGEFITKFILTHSLFGTLAEAHVPIQSLVVANGTARFTATVPPDRAADEVIALVRERFPSMRLERKRRTGIAAPFITRTAFQTLLGDRLTARQWDALSLAFEYGYFERPREVSQTNLAEMMDISPSTFAQHLHTALRKLLRTLFACDPPDGG
jgi:predicted DNA binding protein